MKFCIITITIFIVACNNEPVPKEEKDEAQKEVKAAATKPALVESPGDPGGPAIAELDMGSYVFRVHELTKFEPDAMQSKLMKWDDSEKDYYIVDGSVENKTADVVDTGRDMLSAYFKLSDGSVYKSILRGASVLASYQVMHKRKYPQEQYDLIWKSKFPANETARAHVFGLEVPENAKPIGIGFYQKNAAKNKYADFK